MCKTNIKNGIAKTNENSILQYWFHEINIIILAANKQKWGWVGLC